MSRACLVSWLIFLVILKLGALDVHLGFVVGCHEEEREALLKFRQSLTDTKNVLPSWEGKDCCRWEGVGCDNVTFYVSHLDVHNPYYDPSDFSESSSIISSKLDRSLVELSRLKYLELSRIDFQGSPIPGFIGSFKHLRYLKLSESNFSGVVPSRLGNLTRLHTLDLSSNLFEGSLPTVFFNMSSLRYLDLSGNEFNGSIPLRLNNMRKLEHLDLSYNLLTGPLPRVFANMTSLTYLSLSFNSFNDSIPLSIQNMGKLQNLDLSHNKFSQGEGGATIMGILGNMCKLKSFDLSFNSIRGEIGAHHNLSKCATYSLENLRLRYNLIGGTLSSWLGDFRSLRSLDISDNAIEGPIPVSIGSLSYLEELYLTHNNLTGTLPNSLGGMIKLRVLDVGYSSISGEIPTSVGKLSSLEELHLSSNNLHGVVSESFFTNLSNLQYLDLSSNSLEVNLGSNWSPPFQLSALYLMSCKMQTQFPQWIGKLTSLYMLDLSNNMLSGNLDALYPLESLEELNISHNKLTGPAPYFSSSWLSSIDLSYNLLSGPLEHDEPSDKNDTIGTPICQLPNLVFLNLQSNNIIGIIPDCLGNSSNLEYINLSSNNFSGIIPMSMGQLPSLQFLKLSDNSLQGPIPPTLSTSSSLQILDLGENKLVGNIPTWVAKTNPLLLMLRLRGNQLWVSFQQHCALSLCFSSSTSPTTT